MTETLSIVYRPQRELLPYARNAVLHDDAQLAQIVASIQEFGWTNPILIDENGEVIAGHGRILAAEILAWEKVPTITLTGLSDTQKRAYRLADNRLPRNAAWNTELLTQEMTALLGDGFELGALGFSEQEQEGLLGAPVEFEKEKGQSGVNLNYIVFNRKRIPMSDDESGGLMDKFNEFVAENGSHFGFVAWLLGDRDA